MTTKKKEAAEVADQAPAVEQDATSVTVDRDSRTALVSIHADRALSSDELHTLRKQVDAAYIEVS